MRARADVVVIGERLWRTRFGGDPAIVGKTIPLDGKPFTVIGVAPASFQILYESDIWTLMTPMRSPEQRRMHYLQVLARLKPGVTIEQARSAMDVIAARIAEISPDTNKDWGVTIDPLRESLVGAELRTTSLVLAGVVVFILLMACANVANLMLARGAARAREMAVRVVARRRRSATGQAIAHREPAAGRARRRRRAGPGVDTDSHGAAPHSGGRPAGWPGALARPARGGLHDVDHFRLPDCLFGLAPAWQLARGSLAGAMRGGGRSVAGGNTRLLASARHGGNRHRRDGGLRRRTLPAHAGAPQPGGPRLPRRPGPHHAGRRCP